MMCGTFYFTSPHFDVLNVIINLLLTQNHWENILIGKDQYTDMNNLRQSRPNETEIKLTLKVLVTTIDAQWEGMGDVGSARYEPALLPPCPTIRVLSYSN